MENHVIYKCSFTFSFQYGYLFQSYFLLCNGTFYPSIYHFQALSMYPPEGQEFVLSLTVDIASILISNT